MGCVEGVSQHIKKQSHLHAQRTDPHNATMEQVNTQGSDYVHVCEPGLGRKYKALLLVPTPRFHF